MIAGERRLAGDGARSGAGVQRIARDDAGQLVTDRVGLVTSVTANGPAGEPAGSLVGLRVLFAVDSRFPAIGGAETQALKLGNALRERGATVRFVTPRVGRDQSLHEVHDGFEIERVDYPHLRWFGSLALMVNFARYLLRERGRHDVLHVHITHLLAATAGLMRRRSGLRVLTKISGFYEFEGGVLDPARRFRPLNLLLRAGLRRVDLVQTISEQTRAKLRDAGIEASRILFVPNGIEVREPPAPGDHDGLRIGYCGRLREVKGVHVLLEAFARLLEREPERRLSLVIAGDGTAGGALREQARTLGIERHVEWLGMIEDTRGYLASLDVYVQPSFAEGLPNSVMEAMASALPVVATDIGGNRDLVVADESGLLCPPRDVDALTDRLTTLIADPALRRRFGDAGRASVERDYAMDAVVDRLAAAYRG